MNRFTTITAILIIISIGSAESDQLESQNMSTNSSISANSTIETPTVSDSDQYANASAELENVISNSLGLAVFRPSVIIIDSQIHITFDSTQLGDYPTLADIGRVIELYYAIVAGTGYTGSLILTIKNLDGIDRYRWFIGPNSKQEFDLNQNYVIDNVQQLNPGPEGIAGSSTWLYSDPNYVGA